VEGDTDERGPAVSDRKKKKKKNKKEGELGRQLGSMGRAG
jgi:hypothetical protein